MKYFHLMTMLFLAGSLTLPAQNWMPVNAGETHHFRLDNAGHITHSIRIDSAKQIGLDSVFYLNRIVEPYVLPGNPDTIRTPLRRQGQFLGQTMTRRPDGRLALHAGHEFYDWALYLYPQADSGTYWLADASDQLIATVAGVSEGLVLGEPDSLKVIQFNNGAEWVLSKNHGLLRCTDPKTGGTLELSGLEARKLGDRLYRFEDFFDFELGDVFQHKSYQIGLAGWTDLLEERTVLEKTVQPGYTVYKVLHKYRQTQSGFFNGTKTGADTSLWYFDRYDYRNVSAYPNELFGITNALFSPDYHFSFATFTDTGLTLGGEGLSSSMECSVLREPNASDPILAVLSDAMVCDWPEYRQVLAPGLGATYQRLSVIDNFYEVELVGAIIHGDTVGTLVPGWIFTGTEAPDISTKSGFRLYPNPARDLVWLQPETAISGKVQVAIRNTAGRLVREYTLTLQDEPAVLDLSGIDGGGYILQIRGDAWVWSGKLMVR